MKVVIKSNESDPGVTQELLFQDKAIHKFSIKKGSRKDFKFKDINVSYLTGLVLRYSPLTQKKLFYLRYKYKGKAIPLPLWEFIPGHSVATTRKSSWQIARPKEVASILKNHYIVLSSIQPG